MIGWGCRDSIPGFQRGGVGSDTAPSGDMAIDPLTCIIDTSHLNGGCINRSPGGPVLMTSSHENAEGIVKHSPPPLLSLHSFRCLC